MGVGVERFSATTLPLGLRSVTRCTGGWVGRRAGLDKCGKPRRHRDSIRGPSSLCRSTHRKKYEVVIAIWIIKNTVIKASATCSCITNFCTWPVQIEHLIFLILTVNSISHWNFAIGKRCRSQGPRGLRSGSGAARLLGLWVRMPPGAWMSISCEWCVLSSRDICVWPITCPEESHRVCCAWVWSWILDNEFALAH
jgi:hypothetical protein